MPQARPELQAKFADDSEALEVLEGAGFVLLPDWTWQAPGRAPCIEELDAIEYLMEEWDYGGVTEVAT
jgi:hypothetical protein